MADRTLTINHADGGSETYTLKTEDVLGVRSMSVDGETVTIDRTAPDLVRTIIADGQTITIDTTREGVRTLTVDGTEITIDRSEEANLESFLQQFTGASAAYSLRDLAGIYGNTTVVRVRRSSDNAEADFKASEVSDGTLVTWVGAGNDGFVSTWYDQSGNGNDASQAIPANQPKIVDNGVLLDKLTFSGNQYLRSNTTISTTGSADTTIIVGEFGSSPNSFVDSASSGSAHYIGADTSGQFIAFLGSVSNYRYGSFNTDLNCHIIAKGANSADSYVKTNNASEKINSGVAGYVGGVTIGATRLLAEKMVGSMSELIIYPSQLEDDTTTEINTNIDNYYNLPTQHLVAALNLLSYNLETAPALSSTASSLTIETDGDYLIVEGNENIKSQYPDFSTLSFRINNGSWLSMDIEATYSNYVDLSSYTGTVTVEILSGVRSQPLGSELIGAWINAVYSSPDATIFRAVNPTTLNNPLVIYGDSISTGANATTPHGGYGVLLRDNITRDVIINAKGWDSLNASASDDKSLSALCNKLLSANPTTIYLAIGTNDYGLATQTSSSFQTQYESLLNKLIELDSNIELICASPLTRVTEVPNAAGSSLPDYRNAISNAVANINNPNVTYVDTTGWITTADLDDGVHPTAAGHIKIEAQVRGLV